MLVSTPVPTCEQHVAALKNLFDRVAGVPGLRIAVTDSNGNSCPVVTSPQISRLPDGDLGVVKFALPLESGRMEGPAVQFAFHCVPLEVRTLVIELAQSFLDAAEAARREEALLDELGANWENLENLYELTAEIQGSPNTAEMFGRLLARVSSAHSDVKAGLYIEEAGQLIPVAARDAVLTPLTWLGIPSLAKVVHARRVALIDPQVAGEFGRLSWSNAAALAVAPVATRNAVLGFLIVWRQAHRSGFDSSQLRLLEAIAYQAAVTVERDRLMRAARESERLQRELEIAASIHQLLLVSKPPETLPQLEVAGFNLPSQKIDGDFHDYLTFPDGTLDVLVGDVMGKGLSAALVGAATKNNFLKAVAFLSLRASEGKPCPSQVVTIAASHLHGSLVALERFVTLCYARFDIGRRMLQFVDCGHTGIMLNRKQTGELLRLHGTSLPIGIDLNERYERFEHSILPGDNFLLYSDGVTEAHNVGGELFGEERLATCFESWSSLPVADVIQRIRAEVETFIGGEPLTDDFTCVVVKVTSSRNRLVESHSAEFLPRLTELDSARGWLSSRIKDLAPSLLAEESLSAIELAISEMFSNCVLHGRAALPIRISFERFTDRLRVTVRYQGRSFDVSTVSLPSFDGTREGGFGIYIVSRCADEFVYNQLNDGQFAMSFSKYFRGN